MSGTVQAIDWSSTFTNLMDQIIGFIPKLLVFAVILIIGWIVAKFVAGLVGKLLKRDIAQSALDRSGLNRFFSGPDGVAGIITKLVYYFILLIALQLALTPFGPTNPVTDIVNDIIAFLPRAVVAVVIVIVVAAIANAVQDIMSNAMSTLSYGGLLAKIVYAFILALGIIAALNQMGIGFAVTGPVLIAVLATISGILIVGVGGGMILPMKSRWEGWLGSLESEVSNVKASASAGAPGGYETGAQQQQTYDPGTQGGQQY